MGRSGASELGHGGIAADDPVHDHDVGGRNLTRSFGEVHHPAFNAIFETSSSKQIACSLLIRRRQFDAHHPSHPRLEQLNLESANTAADFEQGETLNALRLQQLDDAS